MIVNPKHGEQSSREKKRKTPKVRGQTEISLDETNIILGINQCADINRGVGANTGVESADVRSDRAVGERRRTSANVRERRCPLCVLERGEMLNVTSLSLLVLTNLRGELHIFVRCCFEAVVPAGDGIRSRDYICLEQI